MNTTKVQPAIKFAYRLLDYLTSNNLIDFMFIAEDFVCMSKDNSWADIGLFTYTIEEIRTQTENWLSESVDDEATKLQEELASMKEMWYWEYVYDYCIRERNEEEDFVDSAAQALIV